MLGFLIAFIGGGAVVYATMSPAGKTWATVYGVATFLLIQLLIGLLIRWRMKQYQAALQAVMIEAQGKVNRQMTIYQRRPPSSMREAQETVNRIQTQASRRMLEILDSCQKLTWWNFLLGKQLNAMRVQLYFQLREFKKVDELLPKSLLLDQQSLAIQLVRFYRNEDAKLDKFYRRKCARRKGDDVAFLACVYAWIKLKQGDAKTALQALIAAKGRSDHAVLLENCEKLQNDRAKNFSNAAFGDPWYSLLLEEPKVKAQRQARMF